MKRYLLFIIFGVTLLWNTSSQAVGELGENGGNNINPHNLSSNSPPGKIQALDTQTYPGKETQICIFCHVPHSATPQSTLWSRPNPAGPFPIRAGLGIDDVGIIGTTLYNNASGNYPNGASRLCLSCHDGVTAIGILANNVSIDMTQDTLTGPSQIILTTSHPISFVYNPAVVGYLNTLPPINSYQLTAAAYLETDSSGKTWVQCTICHQPHKDTRQGGVTFYPFWRVGTGTAADYSTVCAACHVGAPPTALPNEHTF